MRFGFFFDQCFDSGLNSYVKKKKFGIPLLMTPYIHQVLNQVLSLTMIVIRFGAVALLGFQLFFYHNLIYYWLTRC